MIRHKNNSFFAQKLPPSNATKLNGVGFKSNSFSETFHFREVKKTNPFRILEWGVHGGRHRRRIWRFQNDVNWVGWRNAVNGPLVRRSILELAMNPAPGADWDGVSVSVGFFRGGGRREGLGWWNGRHWRLLTVASAARKGRVVGVSSDIAASGLIFLYFYPEPIQSGIWY